MFVEFTGCPTNNTFISLTLIFCVLLTSAQMGSEEGSLLSSGCISAWAVFLCHTAVSNNPNSTCNPKIGDPSPLSISFGLTVTLISLCWTGWSYTAEDTLTYKKENESVATNATQEKLKTEKKKREVAGIVTGDTESGVAKDEEEDNTAIAGQGASGDADLSMLANCWKLNIALATVACWSAVTLTHWGEIQSGGTPANPSVSRVGMWMVIGSQWIVMSLYIWTLVAPRLFPNRDFS
jgi:serine incorporator 1/3